jgi:hypothetical protein
LVVSHRHGKPQGFPIEIEAVLRRIQAVAATDEKEAERKPKDS